MDTHKDRFYFHGRLLEIVTILPEPADDRAHKQEDEQCQAEHQLASPRTVCHFGPRPFGRFTFPAAPDVERFLFVAGGTGISPLRAMYRHALAVAPPQRPPQVAVLYSARTPDEFAYAPELRELAAAGRIELRLTVTRATDAPWHGSRGRIDAAQLGPLVHDAETLCFICGPRAMVDEMPPALAALGVRPDRIRVEEW